MSILFFLLIICFFFFFFFSSRRRHTRLVSDWSSDVCSSDLAAGDDQVMGDAPRVEHLIVPAAHGDMVRLLVLEILLDEELRGEVVEALDLGHGATPQARGVTAALRPAAYRRRLSSRPRSACWGKSAPACTPYAPASPARSGRWQWPTGALGPPARRAATISSPGRSVRLHRREIGRAS